MHREVDTSPMRAGGCSSDEYDFSGHIFTKQRLYGGEEKLEKQIWWQKEEKRGVGGTTMFRTVLMISMALFYFHREIETRALRR